MEDADTPDMDLMRPAGKAVRGLSLLAVAMLAMSACGNAPTSDGFEPVDKAVVELKLTQLGLVISDTRSGTDQALTQQPTRQLVILTRESGRASVDRLVVSALAAHFEPTGATTFHRRSGKGVLIVFYTSANDAGAVAGQPVPSGQSALTVSVTQQ